MASTRPDGTILIRDVPTCRVAATVPSAPSELLSVRFSPDSDTIAATYREGIIRLYSAEYKLRAELHTDGTPWTVAFSPNGEKLAAACWWAGPIQVWDLATNTRDLRLDEPKAAVWEVAYLPGDPTILASASSDGTVRLWDLREQRNILTLDPFDGFDATSVSFTADGTVLIATGRDGSLCVWDFQYYERHMAGNLLYQLALLRPELGEAIRADHLIAWAQEVQRRPWPRIGPHAQQPGESSEDTTAIPGVDPETIAAWGNRSQH
jgi:WD40 repeat protein